MKNKLALAVFMVMLMISGTKLYSQDYSDLISFLGKWEAVMSHYTEKMADCTDLEELSSNCLDLADSVTVYLPTMMKMPEKYPEIDASNPPEELEEIFSKMEVVTTKYTEMLNYLMQVANANSENENFQAAYRKLNLAVYNAMH